MPDSLPELLDSRSHLLRELSQLGDFQPGSITSVTRRCGKPNCHCAQPHDPGHGPHRQLTQKIAGKTVTQTLSSPTAVRKAEKEIAEFRRFQTLAQELVQVSQKICRLRPLAAEELSPGKKKTAETIQQEISREVEHLLRLIFCERQQRGPWDLEAVEMAIRSAMHRAGAAALSQLLQFDPPGPEQRQLPCPCGHTAKYLELRSKPMLTAVGEAQCLRPYYLCERCHHGQFPVDVELDVENTELSPGVRRMLAAVGHEAPFEHGREQMELLAGLSVTTKAVERTAEAIGEDIEVRQQRELERALQLELPIPMGPRIPILSSRAFGPRNLMKVAHSVFPIGCAGMEN